jgi:hypothetical protein
LLHSQIFPALKIARCRMRLEKSTSFGTAHTAPLSAGSRKRVCVRRPDCAQRNFAFITAPRNPEILYAGAGATHTHTSTVWQHGCAPQETCLAGPWLGAHPFSFPVARKFRVLSNGQNRYKRGKKNCATKTTRCAVRAARVVCTAEERRVVPEL